MAADEHLEILLTLDANGYVISAQRVAAANQKITSSTDRMLKKLGIKKAAITDLNQALGSMGTMYRAALGPIGAFATAVLGATAAIGGMVGMGIQKYAAFEAMELSLVGIEGSAQKAKAAIKDLREIAKLPGMNFQGAAETYRKFRFAGLSQEFTKSFIGELGNAVAMSGGNKETVDRVALQLGQIAQAEYLQGDELRILGDAGLPAAMMIRQKFGTSNTEELKKRGITSQMVLVGLLEEMRELPRVQGGVNDALMKLQDAFDWAMVQFGGAFTADFGVSIKTVTAAFNELADAGIMKDFGDFMKIQLETLFGGLAGNGEFDVAKGMINFGATVLDVTEALKNLYLNIKDIVEWIRNPQQKAAKTLFGWIHPDKVAEMEQKMEYAGMSDAAKGFYNTAMMRLENARKKKGTEEEKLTPTGESPEEQAAKLGSTSAKQIPLLREIANNTKPLRDIRDVIIGGGTFTNAAFNPRNIGAWSGSQQRGLGLILKGIETFTLEQAYEMARNRAYSPTSV
jgi:tape measure domain-containing protein